MSSYLHFSMSTTQAQMGNTQSAIETNMPFPLQNTANALPAVPQQAALPTGNTTAAGMHHQKGSGVVESESIAVSTTRAAQTEELAASKSNLLEHYKVITVKLEPEVTENSKRMQFMTWLPNRDSNAHSRTTTYGVSLAAGTDGETVELVNTIDDSIQGDLEKIVEGFVNVQIEKFGLDPEAAKATMAKDNMWGFKPCRAPIIEDITWLKASNKNALHAVGITFTEVGEASQKDESNYKTATKLTQITYQSPIFKASDRTNFQIIVEPNVSQTVHSDLFRHGGKLLQCHNRDESDPFLLNGQCDLLTANESSSDYSSSYCSLDDLDFLWGMANLAYLWPMYVTAHDKQDRPAKRGEELLKTEWGLSVQSKENNSKIADKLMEIERNEQMLLGEKISANLSVLGSHWSVRHNNSSKFFKVLINNNTPRYHLPMGFKMMIRNEYNKLLDRQGVFNNAKEMVIRATPLPVAKGPKYELSKEEVNNVMVIFNVTAYYASQGWCCLPLD